jgi:hypothetical protein
VGRAEGRAAPDRRRSVRAGREDPRRRLNLDLTDREKRLLPLAAARVAAQSAESSEYDDHADEILARYDEVDRKLVAKGFPPTSPWWRDTIERWYRSGKRQAVLRVGRRGGKSSSLSRLAVVEALYGHHHIPPGDIGVGAVISTRNDEAGARLTTIAAILDALGVAHKPWGKGVDGIKLVGRRLGFRVFSASVQGVSGFTAIFVLCDEVAKWKDKDTGANPASEVLKSVRPTMATQPESRIVLSSSPFGMVDAHFDAFEEGETDLQITSHAATWEANPSLTEAETHVLEPDEGAWLREYKAVPQAELESSLLSDVQLIAATRGLRMPTKEDAERHPGITAADIPFEEGRRYWAEMDPATRRHVWTLVVSTQGYDRVRRIVMAREWRPQPGLPLKPSVVLADIKKLVAPYGLRVVHTDQASADALAELGSQAGLTLIDNAWTQPEIKEASEHLLKLLQEDLVELPPDKFVKSDLLGIRKVITRNGVRYEFAEMHGRHSDYAPVILRAVDDSRYRGKAPETPKGIEEKAQEQKARFLKEREREQERAQRMGRMPVTHRRVTR